MGPPSSPMGARDSKVARGLPLQKYHKGLTQSKFRQKPRKSNRFRDIRFFIFLYTFLPEF